MSVNGEMINSTSRLKLSFLMKIIAVTQHELVILIIFNIRFK